MHKEQKKALRERKRALFGNKKEKPIVIHPDDLTKKHHYDQ